ncbi:S-type pyocin domain-containing protein [Kosakonia sp. R1.Fl]|uniref:S-type pyocin domain-containing protein n=1 Tax=Kosakonia sp. R1.Fl TaxID=2928706 RepID=UPI00201E14E2|nr:S-type pyocin domain-containing protein [Kosakonia sp. R1.Fl]MCL6746885.1 S-type pyocin domain-containing protein [Kosakonia sp. R1.Fl]
MPGFEYDGQGSTGMGLNRDPYVRDGNGQPVGIKPGYHAETVGIASPALGSDGAIQITQGINAVKGDINSDNSGENGGAGSSVSNLPLVLHNGQMGYWVYREIVGSEHDRTVKTFIAVGPSEAQKQAAAIKLAQEKQQSEIAAKEFAGKIAQAAAVAEQQRQAAINAAVAAGQYQSVTESQNNLDVATREASNLKSFADNALSQALNKRQAAASTAVAASQAEQVWQNITQTIESKRPRGKSIIAKNGMLGYEELQTRDTAEHTITFRAFVSVGISVAQRDAAQADAVNKRNQANQLEAEARSAEQASLLASMNYNNAETRRQAASAALNAAQQAAVRAAEAERQQQAAEAAAAAAAEQQRLADAAAKAAEDARIAAEQEKARQARQAAADKLKSTDIQSVRGIPASAVPATFPLIWSVASAGGISLDSGVAAGVWSRITMALAELRGIAVAGMSGPVAVVIAGLLYSEDAGAGSDIVPGRDISSIMPSDALFLPDQATLEDAADSGKSVSMPVRGRMVMRVDGTLETQLVRTPVAGDVPVVRAILDKETGYWGYTLPAMPDVPSQTILVSPVDAPGVNGPLGLTGPVPLPETIVHTGDHAEVPPGDTVTVAPVPGNPDFRDFVLIFPAESGLKPLYVMQNSPYGEVTEKGKYSGRPYNPDKAGGPVRDLDWQGAVINQAGIDKVKLHTARFGESIDNTMMIDRLEKILSGELDVTDTDRRFYTHEIRELERYRALGIADGTVPDNGMKAAEVWNNAHTATLEDFKLKSEYTLFYTPEAIKAAEEQEMRGAK